MSGTKSNHKVFVQKKDLTTIGLRPSSQELYDMMHILSCELAEKRWKDEWSFCPVCLCMMDEDGIFVHLPRKLIEV